VLRGVALTESANIRTLAWAPLYAVWKVLPGPDDHGTWTRTPRARRS
jgi:hypothetical protein